MSTGTISDYLHELHTHQSDWAFRAYSRLVKTLSEDVQDKLHPKEGATEPYVVIYGKTQVGKTTLLLDLMGIDPAQMDSISIVMRGGREHGKSATATAMEYCESADERWGLSRQSEKEEFDSDEEFTRQLGLLRQRMESGQLVTNSPCVVHIPKRFFGAANATAPKVRILDLPGDEPANQEEQKHVRQMAKTYLPFADLILLVGKMDDLGFLRPDAITLPGIEDWQAMPRRFRIVTTYSYTDKSVKDILRNNPDPKAPLLRQHLIEQIKTFGNMSEAASSEDLYFPLEFGTSWRSVQTRDPELYQRMSPIIAQLRGELISQISGAATPMGRLRSTLSTHLSVKYIHDKETETIEEEYERLDAKGKEIDGELEIWRKAVKQTLKELSGLKKLLNKQEIIGGESLIQKAADNPEFRIPAIYPPKVTSGNEDCEALRKLIRDYRHLLLTINLDVIPGDTTNSPYWIKVRRLFAEPDASAIEDVLNDAFGPIRSILADYWFDEYFFSDNYQKDLRNIRSAGDDAKEKIVRLWKEAWLTAFHKTRCDYISVQRAKKADYKIASEEYEKSKSQRKDNEEKKGANRAKLEHIERNFEDDLKRCERFIHLLEEEYLVALGKKMKDALESDDDCDTLLQLFSCVQLKFQREELRSLAENSESRS